MRMIAVLALCAALTGCGVPAWQTARGAIAGARGALDAAEPMLPEGEDTTTAVTTTREVLDLGVELTEAWETADERPPTWSWWVTQALEWSARIVTIIKAAGVDVPPQVATAIGGLQLLLPVIAAVAGAT